VLVARLPLERVTLPISADYWLLLGGAGFAFALGLLDDLWDLRARYKLVGQLLLAFVTARWLFSIENVLLPLWGPVDVGSWGVPLTMLWVVAVMNAVNLIDGLDGLAGGLSFVVALSAGTLAWWAGDLWGLVWCVIVAGAVSGFLCFNKPPASIFMGDSGSMLLGYLLSILTLRSVSGEPNGLISLTPILLLGVPLIDTLFAFLRRSLKGIPFYAADKDHLHHRLQQKGFSVWQTALFLSGLGVIVNGLGVFAHTYSAFASPVYLAFILGVYLLLYWLEYDVIVKPVSVVRAQPESKRRRDLIRSLSQNADLYLAKDRSVQELLHSFRFWAELLEIRDFVLHQQEQLLYREGEVSLADGDRLLQFTHNGLRLQIRLKREHLPQDSDLKDEYLTLVAPVFLARLASLVDATETPSLRVVPRADRDVSKPFSTP
jgi:UDP-GlcNAc:undecaprenyl-phosphate GlcNAc-1-phosphate transferase